MMIAMDDSQHMGHSHEGISLSARDKIAAEQTDNEAAALLQTARDRISRSS